MTEKYVIYNLTPNMWEERWVRHLLSELPVSRYESIDLWSSTDLTIRPGRRRRLALALQSLVPGPLRPTRRMLRRTVPSHDYSVFVYNTWGLDHTVRKEFSRLLSRFEHVGLVSVDEASRDSRRTYAHVKFALRVGFDAPKYGDSDSLLVVPLGVPNNFVRPATVKDITDRRFSWSFLGEVKNASRRQMVAQLDRLRGESMIHGISSWDADDSLRGARYSEVVADTVFVPSPPANVHLECYRTYEALECEAIPVVNTTYYRDAFGAPFPIVRCDWEDAPQILNGMLGDPESLEQLHERCRAWWLRLKQDYPARVRQLAS